MATREEIREGILRIVLLWGNENTRVGGRNETDLTKRILEYLHSQGVVIKVDRELPNSPDTDYLISQYEGEEATAEDVALMHLNGIEKGKRLMLKAGYVAVEELIYHTPNSK